MTQNFFRKLVFLLFFLAFFSKPPYVFADDNSDGLTQEEKAEKRLQFNRFVEEELAKEARTKAKESKKEEAAPEKNWSISLTPSYGYERNVNLNSHRQGDTYYEETADAKIKFTHPGFLFLGPGNWGFGGGGDFFNYQHEKEDNYRQLVVGTYADSQLATNLVFKLSYDFSSIDYIHSDPLGYVSHRVKPVLTYSWNKQWAQFVYSSFEFKDYTSRKALSADDFSLEKSRQDTLSEHGMGLRFIPAKTMVFGVTGAYVSNDSNDVFNDFNDYAGPKITGYAFFQLPANFSMIYYGGFDFKKYAGRTFEGSDRTQEDKFFYAGGTLYYDIRKNTQIFLSYLYKQNDSNDITQGYSDYILSAGLTYTI